MVAPTETVACAQSRASQFLLIKLIGRNREYRNRRGAAMLAENPR